jgi:hypothetical protein
MPADVNLSAFGLPSSPKARGGPLAMLSCRPLNGGSTNMAIDDLSDPTIRRSIAKIAERVRANANADRRAIHAAVAELIEVFVQSGRVMIPKDEAEIILREFSLSGITQNQLKGIIEQAASAKRITIEFG